MNLPPSILLLLPGFSATTSNVTMIHEYSLSSCVGRRSVWNIIASCVATLFAGAWTAIHPNMPGPAETAVGIWSRRLGTMILALLAPEMVLLWAMRQLIAARVIQKRFQKALQDGTLEIRVKPCCEPRLVSRNVPYDADEVRIRIPDQVTKSWHERWESLSHSTSTMFRRPSSHVREKLGPSSVAVESMNNYCCWTLKHSFFAWMGGFMLYVDRNPYLPREAYHPLTPDELLEFLKADLVQMSMVSEKDLDGRSKGDWLSKAIVIMQLVWFVVQLAARAFKQLPTTQLEIGSLAISILSCFTYVSWWYKPKDAQCPVPVYCKEPGELPEIKYSVPQSVGDFFSHFGAKKSWSGDRFGNILQPMLNLGGIESVSDAAVKARRVPYLCGYYPDVDKESLERSLPIYTTATLAGVVFGGVHCIAWNFTYPTYTEQILWRVSCITMAVTPGLALLIVAYAYLTIDDRGTVPHAGVAASAMLIVHSLYVSCRLAVIVLTLLSLRSLPSGVFVNVRWTSLIPHW